MIKKSIIGILPILYDLIKSSKLILSLILSCGNLFIESKLLKIINT